MRIAVLVLVPILGGCVATAGMVGGAIGGMVAHQVVSSIGPARPPDADGADAGAASVTAPDGALSAAPEPRRCP